MKDAAEWQFFVVWKWVFQPPVDQELGTSNNLSQTLKEAGGQTSEMNPEYLNQFPYWNKF